MVLHGFTKKMLIRAEGRGVFCHALFHPGSMSSAARYRLEGKRGNVHAGQSFSDCWLLAIVKMKNVGTLQQLGSE